MKTFEEFCNSNILHVILENHNEGGSRDVDRLTRMAYDEYTNCPHLRHIEGYYLRKITFFPPKLSPEELRQCQLHNTEACFVDLYSDDNWCLKTERYLLDKLKRTDTRDNCVIANDMLFRKNLPIIIFKYCRNKFKEEREQRLEAEREKQKQAGTSRRSIITDFFKAKGPKSPRKKKMQMLRLFNPEEESQLIYSPNTPPPSEELQQPVLDVPAHIYQKPGPASSKRLLMERYLKDVATANKEQIVTAEEPIKSTPQEDPSADQELEDIKKEFRMRNLPLKAGPKSKLKANLKRLQQMETKIKAGPASKKRKQLMKIYGAAERNPEVVVVEEQTNEGQENIADNTPPMQPTAEDTNKEHQSDDKYKNVERGTRLWMLLYSVYDPVKKIFVDPNPPSPEKPPQVIEPPIPAPVQRRRPVAKFAPPNSSSPMPVKPLSPKTPSRPPNKFVAISQASSIMEDGLSLENILEKNARELFHPKLFHHPEVLRRVKEMVVEKAKLFNAQKRLSLDKSTSSSTQSQDSLVTVVQRTRTTTTELEKEPQSTPKEKDNSITEPSNQQQNVSTTEPEMILCDPTATQSQFLNTQVAVDPFQSQQAMESPQKKKMNSDESQIEISTVPEEIIVIEEDSTSLDEILGISSAKSGEETKESPVEETPKKSPKEIIRQTPNTRSRIKLEATPSTSAATTPTVKPTSTKKASPVGAPRTVRGNEKETGLVAFRYEALPLQHKGGAGHDKPSGKKRGRKPKTKQKDEEIHTKVRFLEQTEGTALGMDIQDASMVKEQLDTPQQNPGKSKRSLIESLEEILGQRRREAAEDATEVNAFSFNKVMKLSHELDEKGKFYSDSCGRCALEVEFTVDGQRRLQFDVDINRHLLDLTQDQWESFQRLMQSVNKFEYSGWTRSGGGFFPGHEEEGRNCCIIKKTLNLLLKTTPKLGVNVGAIRHSTGIGTRPVFLRTIPDGHGPPKLDLTECINPDILKRMEEIVTARKKRKEELEKTSGSTNL